MGFWCGFLAIFNSDFLICKGIYKMDQLTFDWKVSFIYTLLTSKYLKEYFNIWGGLSTISEPILKDLQLNYKVNALY